jgi:hypothetical protein
LFSVLTTVTRWSKKSEEIQAVFGGLVEREFYEKESGTSFLWEPWVFFLAFFLIALLSQIGTTQSALLGEGQSVNFFRPNWEILLQLPRLVGFMPPAFSGREGATVLMSWFISLAFVGCVVGNEIFDDAKRERASFLHGCSALHYGVWSVSISGLICSMEARSSASVGVRFLFAIIVAFIVAYAGVLGVDFLEKAYKSL